MFREYVITFATPGPAVAEILIGLFRRLGCHIVERGFDYLVSHDAVRHDDGRPRVIPFPKPEHQDYERQMTYFLTGAIIGYVGTTRDLNPPFFAFLAALNAAVPLPPMPDSPPQDPPISDPPRRG